LGISERLKNKLQENSIKQHPKAASRAQSMKKYAQWVKTYSSLNPKNIFEIGANYAQDAEGLRYYLNLEPEDVWVFEAHPDICKEIEKLYHFHIYNVAVFNQEKEIPFNTIDINATTNSGISSLYQNDHLKEKTKAIKVKAIRMENFMKEHKISKIDFLKLDVEGSNYEVLEGFGDRLVDVNVIHIESEHQEVWTDQKLYSDIEIILKKNGFEMVIFERYLSQSDSLWVQEKYIKKEF
jgi:FkbM family methyltransferase